MNDIVRQYPITLSRLQTIPLPDGARIVSVRMDGRAVLILGVWVDPAAEAEGRMSERTIRVVREGERTGTATRFVGDVEPEGGERAWVFEGP